MRETSKIKKQKTRAIAVRRCLPCKHFSKKNIVLLNALCHADNRQRAALVQAADKGLLKCICECALNVLQDRVKINDAQKSHLKKHKKMLRNLIDTTATTSNRGNRENLWKNKKRVIVQSGGSFLPILLGPLLSSLLSAILPKKWRKKIYGESTQDDFEERVLRRPIQRLRELLTSTIKTRQRQIPFKRSVIIYRD